MQLWNVRICSTVVPTRACVWEAGLWGTHPYWEKALALTAIDEPSRSSRALEQNAHIYENLGGWAYLHSMFEVLPKNGDAWCQWSQWHVWMYMANGCKWYVHWCVLSLANVYLSNVQISIADLETRWYIESVYIINTHKCCWWLVGFHAYFRKAPNESLILFQAHFTAGFMHNTIRHTCPWHHVLIVAFLLLLAGHQAHRPPMWELTQLTFLFLCTGCDSQYNSTESIHQG